MASGRRKGFEALSPAYQRRVERTIGRKGYESGKSLSKARGKGSDKRESDLRKLNRIAKRRQLPRANLGPLYDAMGGYEETKRFLETRNSASDQRVAGIKDSPDIDYMRTFYTINKDTGGTIPEIWFAYNRAR